MGDIRTVEEKFLTIQIIFIMGIIKTIALRIALNRKQRLVIWNALQYSDHKYREHGDIDRAVVTTATAAEVERAFGIARHRFTEKEVSAIVDDALKRSGEIAKRIADEAYERGKRETLANIAHLVVVGGQGLKVGDIVEVVEEAPAEEEQEHKEGESEKQQNPPASEGAESEAPSEGTAEGAPQE